MVFSELWISGITLCVEQHCCFQGLTSPLSKINSTAAQNAACQQVEPLPVLPDDFCKKSNQHFSWSFTSHSGPKTIGDWSQTHKHCSKLVQHQRWRGPGGDARPTAVPHVSAWTAVPDCAWDLACTQVLPPLSAVISSTPVCCPRGAFLSPVRYTVSFSPLNIASICSREHCRRLPFAANPSRGGKDPLLFRQGSSPAASFQQTRVRAARTEKDSTLLKHFPSHPFTSSCQHCDLNSSLQSTGQGTAGIVSFSCWGAHPLSRPCGKIYWFLRGQL